MATLVTMTIGSGVYRITDYGISVIDGAIVYSASFAGGPNPPIDIISVSDVQETGALKVNELTLEIGGADRTIIAALLANDSKENYVSISRAVVDELESYATALSSFVLFDGRITSFAIDDSERESRISISVASHWADFEKVMNRRTNLNSQQIYFPTDLGMQYASKITKDLKWGRE